MFSSFVLFQRRTHLAAQILETGSVHQFFAAHCRSRSIGRLDAQRSTALHTVSLFRPSVLQSIRSAGTAFRSQTQLSLHVALPRDPFSSSRFLFTPCFLSFERVAFTSESIGFLIVP